MVYRDYPQSLDRRKASRIYWVDSEAEVVMIPSNTQHRVTGWVLDISPGGFKVKLELPRKFAQFFPERGEIYFETFEDFFQLKGHGRVVWASINANTVGIQFDRLDEESKTSLYGFLGILPIG